jgi:hypothetical protein
MGHYATMMNIFDVPGATPVQVSDAVFVAAVADPQAFLALVIDDVTPNGRVCMFHCLQ